MTKREFVLLAVRLLSVYIIGTAVSSLVWLSYGFLDRTYSIPFVVRFSLGIAPFFVQICFGIVLWIISSAVAHHIVGHHSGNEAIQCCNSRDVACFGLMLTGVFFLYQGVWILGESIGSHGLSWLQAGGNASLISPDEFLLSSIPSSVVGLILVFGARFLSFWIAPRKADFAVPTTEIEQADAAQ